MSQADDRLKKRHWFLAVWSVPQPGAYVPMSAFVWSKSRAISIPVLNAARESRKLPEGSTLINVAYVGYMNEFELTGTSPEPVASVTSAAYTLGLEQTFTVPDPSQLVNAFPESDTFNHQEWAMGAAVGRDMRAKIVAASSRPPANDLPIKEEPDVR